MQKVSNHSTGYFPAKVHGQFLDTRLSTFPKLAFSEWVVGTFPGLCRGSESSTAPPGGHGPGALIQPHPRDLWLASESGGSDLRIVVANVAVSPRIFVAALGSNRRFRRLVAAGQEIFDKRPKLANDQIEAGKSGDQRSEPLAPGALDVFE